MLKNITKFLPIFAAVFVVLLVSTYLVYNYRINQLTVKKCTVIMSKNQYNGNVANVSVRIENPSKYAIGSFYFYVRYYPIADPRKTIAEVGYQVNQTVPAKEDVSLSFSGLVREELGSYSYECKIRMF